MSDVKDKQAKLEAVGPAFVKEKMLEMRGKTRKAIHAIAAACKPGMVEEDAVQMAKDILAADDMVRVGHDVYVRFGSNTLKTFGAASEPGVVLKENDLFIDIGPVGAISRAMVATPSSLARRPRWPNAPRTPRNSSTSCAGNGKAPG